MNKFKFPIVKVATKDGYILHGLLQESKIKSKNIIIHIHGSAGNFYQSNFYTYLFKMAEELGYAFLTTNNRGTGVYDVELGTKYRGAAIEIFEDCLLDIDAWIEYAINLGYENIILEGHSFGTNKIQYYYFNGKYKLKIKALILLGFTDSYGGQLEYLKSNNLSNEHLLKEARKLISDKKPLQLLPYPLINWGELPQTAQSYLSFMKPNSVLSKILPLRNKVNLENFHKIDVPILGIVGDHNECTVLPPKEAVELLMNENKKVKCYMIKGSNHTYKDKESELIKLIKNFLGEKLQ